MKEKEEDDLAIEIACRMGHLYTDDYVEGLYRSAEFYKEMTGKDIGLKRPEKKTYWQLLKERIIKRFI